MIDPASLSEASRITSTTSQLDFSNRLDHFLARMGYRRGEHRVEPGLYALGRLTPQSPVFVTANYTLSFDALRSALAGVDAYILVLDTKGINVWCAAGKGTFGTDEIVHRVFTTGLKSVVSHRKLILPQLGAPGVAAHLVKKQTGFQVEYGPVRAADLPEYLKTNKATPQMRRVRFPLKDRVVLIPVEVTQTLLWIALAVAAFYLLGGWFSALAALTIFAAGLVLFPILLPWLPTHNFSTKGFILGALAALPFAVLAFLGNPDAPWWRQGLLALQFLLLMPPAVAFITLNFTGSTTFTSRSGVRREIFRYIPVMAWMTGLGVVSTLAALFLH
jgi:hypothetical protein